MGIKEVLVTERVLIDTRTMLTKLHDGTTHGLQHYPGELPYQVTIEFSRRASMRMYFPLMDDLDEHKHRIFEAVFV